MMGDDLESRDRQSRSRVMLAARALDLQLSVDLKHQHEQNICKAVLTHGDHQEYLSAEHASREESYF